MVKTQLNPSHRLYTIKLALDAPLLYWKSTLMEQFQVYDTTSHSFKSDELLGANVCFADGHVEWRKYANMDRRSMEGWYLTHWW
jgi:prepilin-type processing-associated H-X9-DG protein